MLNKPSEFFAALRDGKLLGPTLTQSEVDGVNAILGAAEGFPLSWVAYMLATAYLETAHEMQPIKEKGADSYFFRRYDKDGNNPGVAASLGNIYPGDGAKFAGRGYVQLTGRNNYERADRKLSLNGALLANPDMAMNPSVAAKIMRLGMSEGWFTGKSLTTYLPKTVGERAQFTQARRIINGLDRAPEISGYALEFQDALQAGEWS